MSYLLSLAKIPSDPGQADETRPPGAARRGEILRATPPSPVSGLIAEVFGDASRPSVEPVLFTSMGSGEGVSWTASAVAAELAATGRKVLLAEGIVVASLSRNEDVVALCDRVGPDQIWVLGPGQVSRCKFPLSASRGCPGVILSALREEFPYIVLDAPALSKGGLTLRLAPLTAGAVLVLRKSKSEPRAVVEACKQFAMLGSRVLGCVYNAQ